MIPKPYDLKTLVSECRTMNIEELKARIEHLRSESKCLLTIKSIDIAKKELELKYKERKEQIDILSKSLTSSSRISRWVSSFRAVLSKIVETRN
tara:strand:- start:173 stop:454 length:282 start_codon:yes stop_codon:yes gene_type:complete